MQEAEGSGKGEVRNGERSSSSRTSVSAMTFGKAWVSGRVRHIQPAELSFRVWETEAGWQKGVLQEPARLARQRICRVVGGQQQRSFCAQLTG